MQHHLDNKAQLRRLERAYTQCEGALEVSRAAQASADQLVARYMALVSALVGEDVPQGARVHVDFDTGEIQIGESTNGVVV